MSYRNKFYVVLTLKRPGNFKKIYYGKNKK